MFVVEKKLGGALGRAGKISTNHGNIFTPAFIPVGTKATVKSLTPEQIKDTGSQAVLANTYHLYLEPGEKLIRDHGGLAEYMNWQGPTITDSGGFQAFSLGVAYGEGIGKFINSESPEQEVLDKGLSSAGKFAKVSEEGIEFKSIIDGSTHFLSPEKSIQIQNNIGADIIFALDEFTSPHASHDKIKSTIERTNRWAERCLQESKILNLKPQMLFGIVQGGRFEDLRKESARQVSSFDFSGFGIGGTFIKEDMATAVRWVNEILPEEKPRHLLGVGEPIDLFLGVENGCDTFDCVAPTRMARNGGLYTRQGKINITNSKFKSQILRPDPDCGCYTCQNYTASYLSHLFRANEMLAATLATIHNLHFINTLMKEIRQSILDETFYDFKENFFRDYLG